MRRSQFRGRLARPEECREELFASGRVPSDAFVALVEYDSPRSGAGSNAGRMQPGKACRTGRCVHLKRDAYALVFDMSVAADQPCVFVEPDVIEGLQSFEQPCRARTPGKSAVP